MHSASDKWTVARQMAFFAPADMRGKSPVCGAAVTLGSDVIHSVEGQQSDKVHPLACKRCVRLSTSPGVSAQGMEQ